MPREAVYDSVQIRLLGEFEFLYNGQVVGGLYADRPQSLLAFLLLHHGTPQSRQRLAFLLWPDSTEGQARTNLRNLLHTLRQTIPNADKYIVANSATIHWQLQDNDILDVVQFETALQKAGEATDPEAVRQSLESAVSLYQGDLLPGNYDDWLMPIREALRQRYLTSLHHLVASLESQAAYATASRYCQRLLQQDPFDESAAVQLMRLQALAGDRASLRRTYQTLTAALRRELGVEPAHTTQEAYIQLLQHDVPPSLSAITTSHKWTPRPLPIPATPFLGREKELAEIAQRLAQPACRLLTILGLGGMGKTRLALQTAVAQNTTFKDGVAFVPLVGLETAALLIPAIADALQFRFAGSAELHTQLFNFLSQKEMLIVLDNFEHLHSQAGQQGEINGEDWIVELLHKAPNTRLLVTSRQRLGLQEEWIYEIGGLDLPDTDDPSALDHNSALALFQQSASRINSHFQLDPTDLPHVVKICTLVGGMPLGIELAASWVRLLSCAEIAKEIEKGLAFLTGSARNMPERHRSIRAVFDHSWSLLSKEEQATLARFSLFRGGFTREAAEKIAQADLRLISALVDKSLVRRSQARRYDLHELIRQYAAHYLQKDAVDEQRSKERYVDYYLNLLHERDKNLRSHQQKSVLAELNRDIDNLRSAWDLAVNGRHVTLLQRAAYPYWYFYNLRDFLNEGKLAFRRASEMVQNEITNISQENNAAQRELLEAVLGQLLTFQAQFAFRQGHISQSASVYQTSVSLLRPLSKPTALSDSLTYYGVVQWIAGEFCQAWSLLNESLTLLKLENDSWREAQTLTFMGMVAYSQGDYADSYRYLQQSISYSNALGDPRLISLVAGQLGRAAYALGRMNDVVGHLHTGLRLATDIGDRLGIGFTLEQLGMAAESRGEYESAYRLINDSIKQFDDIQDMWFLAQAHNSAGTIALKMKSYDVAKRHFQQAGKIALENQAPPNALESLVGFALIDLKEGHQERAFETASLVLEHPASTQFSRHRAQQIRETLEVNFIKNRANGRTQSCYNQLLPDFMAAHLTDNFVLNQ